MKDLIKSISQFMMMLMISLVLIACSKITQSNFDKIQNNMTMKEVVAILGEPTSSDSLNIAGMSGATAVWKDGDAQIDIQFINDRVIIKAFSNESNAKSNVLNPKQKQ
jgi:hypothetical protein